MPAGHDARLRGKTGGRGLRLQPRHSSAAAQALGLGILRRAPARTGDDRDRNFASRAQRLPAEVEEAAAGLQALSLEFARQDRPLESPDRAWRVPRDRGEGKARDQAIAAWAVARDEHRNSSRDRTGRRFRRARRWRSAVAANRRTSRTATERTPAWVSRASVIPPIRPMASSTTRVLRSRFTSTGCSAPPRRNARTACRRCSSTAAIRGSSRVTRVPRKSSLSFGRCPSGALRYTRKEAVGPEHAGPPSIRIRKNGPYEVRGRRAASLTLLDGAGLAANLRALPLRRLEEQAVLRRLALAREFQGRCLGVAHDPYLTEQP